jgi:PGF-pre-PGF domain-containing protein/PGF-CTERM protein
VTVVDAWGDPLPGADVLVSHDRDDVSTGVTFETDDRGRLVARDGGPHGVEVPESVTVSAVTESAGVTDATRSLTVTTDRTVTLAVADTADASLVVDATPAEVTAGESVRVTLNRSRDDRPVDGTVAVNGTTHATGPDGAVNVTLNQPGTYKIDGRTELATGRVVTDSVSLTVAAGERSDAGGGGGGGGAAGGTPVPPAGVVDVRETDAGALVTAEKVKGGRLIRELLPNVATEDVAVEQFAFTLTADDRRFTAELTASDEVPPDADVPAMDGTLGYLRVETEGLTATKLKRAQLRFEVSRAAMDELGASPDAVQLYRYHDGAWRAVETRHAGGTTFVGVTPGFSVFAVGVQSPDAGTQTPTATPTPTDRSPATTASSGEGSSSTPNTTETTGPGFGPLVSLVALLAVALLTAVRRRE